MERTMLSDITVTSEIKIQSIKEMKLEIRPEQHAILQLVGTTRDKRAMEKVLKEGTIQLEWAEVTGENIAFFHGSIANISIGLDTGNQYKLELQAQSMDGRLDEKRKHRSFQDTEMTYHQLIDEILADTPGAKAVIEKNGESKIGRTFIQYNETDWQFLKRIASHLHMSIYPITTSNQPEFSIGLPLSEISVDFGTSEFQGAVERSYYKGEKPNYEDMMYKCKTFYYIRHAQDYELGNRVVFRGSPLVVCGKQIKYIKGRREFFYVLAGQEFLETGIIRNLAFRGCEIWGRVADTDGQSVFVHLDIDKNREMRVCHPYPLLAGCKMPEKSKRVALYFPNDDENQAVVVNHLTSDD